MKQANNWRRHLQELVTASLDPMVYAAQWAQDPRRIQRGAAHRRVGAFATVKAPVCRLWAQPRKWG